MTGGQSGLTISTASTDAACAVVSSDTPTVLFGGTYTIHEVDNGACHWDGTSTASFPPPAGTFGSYPTDYTVNSSTCPDNHHCTIGVTFSAFANTGIEYGSHNVIIPESKEILI